MSSSRIDNFLKMDVRGMAPAGSRPPRTPRAPHRGQRGPRPAPGLRVKPAPFARAPAIRTAPLFGNGAAAGSPGQPGAFQAQPAAGAHSAAAQVQTAAGDVPPGGIAGFMQKYSYWILGGAVVFLVFMVFVLPRLRRRRESADDPPSKSKGSGHTSERGDTVPLDAATPAFPVIQPDDAQPHFLAPAPSPPERQARTGSHSDATTGAVGGSGGAQRQRSAVHGGYDDDEDESDEDGSPGWQAYAASQRPDYYYAANNQAMPTAEEFSIIAAENEELRRQLSFARNLVHQHELTADDGGAASLSHPRVAAPHPAQASSEAPHTPPGAPGSPEVTAETASPHPAPAAQTPQATSPSTAPATPFPPPTCQSHALSLDEDEDDAHSPTPNGAAASFRSHPIVPRPRVRARRHGQPVPPPPPPNAVFTTQEERDVDGAVVVGTTFDAEA